MKQLSVTISVLFCETAYISLNINTESLKDGYCGQKVSFNALSD